jgi:Fur family ferric uptake transcriptional regulator
MKPAASQKFQRINQALNAFRRYCTSKKMRYTPEREMIIKEIYNLDSHFNIDHLFSRIRQKNPHSKIAKTSIYRSVPYFLDAGLLRESISHAGHVIYERTLGCLDHDHFRCVNCGKIAEFYSPALEQAQKKICRKENFKVLWRTNVINGYCERCRGQEKAK